MEHPGEPLLKGHSLPRLGVDRVAGFWNKVQDIAGAVASMTEGESGVVR